MWGRAGSSTMRTFMICGKPEGKKPGDGLEAEKQSLKEAWERQKCYYADDIEYLIRAAEKLRNLICEVSDMFEKGTE